jgi:hypothetical protein
MTFPTIGLRVLAFAQRRGLNIARSAPANLSETIRAGDNVTYWASSAKAIRELGFETRPLEQGVKDTWGSTT